MSVSILDGTIESVELRRKAPAILIFKKIVFRLPDGETKTILKPIAHKSLEPHLQPGTSGRFYLFNAIDHRGIHGVRTAPGAAVQAHPKNNEVIGMVLTGLGLFMLITSLLLLDGVSIWTLIVIVLGPLVWIANRKTRMDGERQFADDNGPAPTLAANAG